MHRTRRSLIFNAAIASITLTFALFGLHSPGSGQWITPSAPPIISFMGTLHVPGTDELKNAKARYTLDLDIDGQKKWVFLITKARNVSYAATENQIFNDLTPPFLNLTGDKKLMDKLSQDDIAGKTILIKGILYKDAHRFVVSKVEPWKED
ncbi:MAG TPA: hypothetical protein PKM59_14860 [Thermodesulfobacteriota bacterium]|nr:hypothetical protein [Thermodesulfobacteriota bacterium]